MRLYHPYYLFYFGGINKTIAKVGVNKVVNIKKKLDTEISNEGERISRAEIFNQSNTTRRAGGLMLGANLKKMHIKKAKQGA